MMAPPVTVTQRERTPVARSQEVRLAVPAATPHRPDRMDHVARGEAEPGRELRVAGRAAPQRLAGVEQGGARGPVDRAVDAAAAEEAPVGGVDDRVDRERRDVGPERLKAGGHRRPGRL